MHRFYRSIFFLAALTAAGPLAAQDPAADSVDRNYRDELPRIAPLDPASAMASFRVADGYRIEQLAAEPLVVDPVAMAFDEFGRLWVVEMRGYSEDDQANLGRIRVLEDTDGDGRFDRSHVFCDGLSWPTAITCYDGGVFVGAAPDLWYLKDRDGDGRADDRRIVVSGFGRSNVQGLMNTLTWGLDNRIHGATSSSGAELRSPSRPDAEPLMLRGRDFSFDPRTESFAAESGGGQHGLSFNLWGDKFVCSNSNHIQYVFYDDRYTARNPYLKPPSPTVGIAEDGPQADVFRTSPVEPWRIVRTRLRRQGIVPGPVERGGKAAGYFTGATGITIYRGANWPALEDDQFWAIVGDVGSNLIHRKRVDARGVGYTARRVDASTEFVTSSDIWFRPVQFANGPGGGLYVADMYREVIEHPQSLPPVIKKHLDLTSGRDRGRIYQIVGTSPGRPLPVVGRATTAELVALLDHPNDWHRETAARLLYERQDVEAVGMLEQLAVGGARAEGRIRALYGLASLGRLSDGVLEHALSDAHSRVRQHAVRLSEPRAAHAPAIVAKLLDRTADPDLRVRYQLAFSLGAMPGPRRNQALAELARRDAGDPYFDLALLSSLAEGAGAVLVELAEDAQFRSTEAGRGLLHQLAVQIARGGRPDDVAALLVAAGELAERDPAVLAGLAQAVGTLPGNPVVRQLAAATGGRSDQMIAEIVARSLRMAADPKSELQQRIEGVHQLRLASWDDVHDLFRSLLAPDSPEPLQRAVLDTLAGFRSPEVATMVVDHWAQFSPSQRRQASELLFSRRQWLEPFLDAILQGTVRRADVDPARLALLRSSGDARLRALAESIGQGQAGRRRDDLIQSYRDVLALPADAARGKAVFAKHCAGCHQAEGVGHEIAPQFATLKSRGAEFILVNLLDPNREVNPQYLNYVLATKDGRSLTGMISAETATSITLKRADNAEDIVLRVDIEQLKSTGLSLMPEGLEQLIDRQSMADLIHYIMSL